MTDYIDDLVITVTGLTLERLRRRTITKTPYTPDARFSRRAAKAPFQFRLEGSFSNANENLTTLFVENLLGLHRRDETMLLRTDDFGTVYVTLDEYDAEVETGDNEARVSLLMAYVGTTSTHERGFDFGAFAEVSNDWGI